ncbi:hypothetical protein K1T71_013945 [Dendrolimus kikuchii]|uniref:Uncharacterized protein n=1 Tax=Dendrolimus kikuchii TaxID=765133 RepID=A0ACC1CGI9_9NEOP|nr:hypothetical protein K1T71_013945 [Dendrolimus kikuchii]
MLIKIVLLITILGYVQSKLSIDISTDPDDKDVSIEYSGIEISVITDEDISLFNIDTANLKAAFKKHYGKVPSNIYLKSPTPWGDLYETYKWEQVTKVLSVKSARVKSNVRNPIVVLTQDFVNLSNNTVKVNTGISHTVENTLTTSWNKEKEFTVSQEFEYDVNFLFGKAQGTTAFSYTTTWGTGAEQSETTTIGSTSAVETELAPGKAVTAILSANAGILEIEVIYKMSLRGNVAVNFKKAFRDHHFWGPPIQNVMASGGIDNEVTVYETIKFGYHVDASLKVFDRSTGKPV